MICKAVNTNNWPIWFFIFGLISMVACQPIGQVVKTPVTQQILATENVPSTATITPTIAPSATVTLTSLPTPTNTVIPTPTPTILPLQKVSELPINSAYFTLSSDGMLLATVDRDTGILYIFDTRSGELKWEIEEENRGMTGYILDFSPDGNFLAGGGGEQDVYVWNMNTGETTYILSEPYDTVDSVSFSSDGELLAVSAIETYSSPYRIMVWNMDTGQPLADQFNADDYGWYVVKTAFVPNHPHLLAITSANFNTSETWQEGYRPGGLYFWDVDNQQLQEVLTGTLGELLTTSPGGQFVAMSIDGYLRVWDMQNEVEILSLSLDETSFTTRIALTDTGLIAHLDSSGTLTLWSLQGWVISMLTSDRKISDMDFTLSGELLIAYLADNTPIEVWHVSE